VPKKLSKREEAARLVRATFEEACVLAREGVSTESLCALGPETVMAASRARLAEAGWTFTQLLAESRSRLLARVDVPEGSSADARYVLGVDPEDLDALPCPQ
jgi:hypothetical protein